MVRDIWLRATEADSDVLCASELTEQPVATHVPSSSFLLQMQWPMSATVQTHGAASAGQATKQQKSMKQNPESSGATRYSADFASEALPRQLSVENSTSGRFDPSTLHAHAPVLRAYAVRELRDRMLAEDVVQETFLAALSGAGQRFNGASSVRTWLIAILKNKIIDALRERAKSPLCLDASSCADHEEHGRRAARSRFGVLSLGFPDCLVPEPDVALAFTRFLESCQEYLDALPSQTARVFLLTEVLGHTAGEAGVILGISTANVWVIRHRTLKKLRLSLESGRPV